MTTSSAEATFRVKKETAGGAVEDAILITDPLKHIDGEIANTVGGRRAAGDGNEHNTKSNTIDDVTAIPVVGVGGAKSIVFTIAVDGKITISSAIGDVEYIANGGTLSGNVLNATTEGDSLKENNKSIANVIDGNVGTGVNGGAIVGDTITCNLCADVMGSLREVSEPLIFVSTSGVVTGILDGLTGDTSTENLTTAVEGGHHESILYVVVTGTGHAGSITGDTTSKNL